MTDLRGSGAETMPRGETPPRVSILVVTWNSWRDLERCLESLRALDYPDTELVVVDNGSTDGTPERLRERFPEARLEANATNLGLPAAVNQGLARARGEYLLLLDVDTEVAEDAVSRLVEFMDARPDVSLAAARIFTPDGDIEESARNFPSFMAGLFGRQSLLTRLFPRNRFSSRYLARENLGRGEPFQVQQVSAACMFMRRELVQETGPWDEGFRCYWIDTDYCKTVHELGRKVFCVPAARVVHHENNKAGKKKSPWRIWHFHLGAHRVFRKHDTWGYLDPRSVVALILLVTRAGLMMVWNATVPRPAEAGPEALAPPALEDERP